MADEERTTNADSFATLGEAIFAEDWDSKEDRVYDEPEARLERLLKAASPGPWHSRSHSGQIDDSGDFNVAQVFSVQSHRTKVHRPLSLESILATKELIALSPALATVALRLARALRRQAHRTRYSGKICWCTTDKYVQDFCVAAEEALADWDRLLKELGDG